MNKQEKAGGLGRRIAAYSTLATVIGFTMDASGQIVYTDVNPDFGGVEATYMLDLNNDGAVDFKVIHLISSGENVLYFDTVSEGARVVGELHDIGRDDPYGVALAFDEGGVISYNKEVWLKGTQGILLNSASCYSGFSHWCGVTDKYVGLRFKINGSYHFGWARLDVSLSGKEWRIKDYAYNSESGKPIKAGDTGK